MSSSEQSKSSDASDKSTEKADKSDISRAIAAINDVRKNAKVGGLVEIYLLYFKIVGQENSRSGWK